MSAITLGLSNQPTRKPFFWGYVNDLESVTPLADDTWYHVASTLQGTSVKVYIDGGLDVSGTLSGLNTPAGTTFFLADFTAIMTNFGGLLDEVAVYDRALSPAEIQLLAAVPEPSTFALSALGLLALGLRRRRRRR